jgi:hypothetical protein
MSFVRLLCLSLTLFFLAGCAGRGVPQALSPGETAAGRAILQASAEAHGLAAWRQLRDVSVAYEGEWYGVVSRLQPTLIDAAYRQGSEERLLLADAPVVGQSHRGPGGQKQVLRTDAEVQVVYDGLPAADAEVRDAAALVADGYRLFITGPFYFLSGNVHLERIDDTWVNGHHCDILLAVRRPGLGFATEERFLLYIDREQRWLRRVRFTLDGLASTQGAVAEVDFFDHRRIAGVIWPTRFYERLKKPIPNLPVHDWRLIGLDVDRGMTADELAVPGFAGRAAVPARRLETAQ